MKSRTFLRYVSNSLEILCRATHPFVRVEILLTGRHCNLANLSAMLDEKYNLGVWKKRKITPLYYRDYPVPLKEKLYYYENFWYD